MATISEEEKLRRRESVESVIGTNAMEGIFLDKPTLALMRQFELGEIEIEQLSTAIQQHVQDMDLSRQSLSVPTERIPADAA